MYFKYLGEFVMTQEPSSWLSCFWGSSCKTTCTICFFDDTVKMICKCLTDQLTWCWVARDCDLAVRGSSKRLLLQHPANQTKTHNVFSGLDPRTRKLGLVNNPTRSFLCVWHSGIHVWLPCCLTLIKRVVMSGNGYFCKRRSHRSGVILTIRENLMRIDPIKCGLSTISLSFSLWFSRSIYLYIYIYTCINTHSIN